MQNARSLENLKKNLDLTPIERKNLAKKAGIASGKARKEKANFNKALTQILEGKPSNDLINILKEQGIRNTTKLNYLESILLFTTHKAFAEKTTLGELVRYLTFIRDTLGQMPVQQVYELSQIDKQDTERVIRETLNKLKII